MSNLEHFSPFDGTISLKLIVVVVAVIVVLVVVVVVVLLLLLHLKTKQTVGAVCAFALACSYKLADPLLTH